MRTALKYFISLLFVFTHSMNVVFASEEPLGSASLLLRRTVFPLYTQLSCGFGSERSINNTGYVRISSEQGPIDLYNAKLERWVSSLDSWSLMPLNDSVLKIRFTSATNKTYSLRLIYKNVKTGIEITSQPQQVWVGDYSKKFIYQTNKSLNDVVK